MSYLFMLRNVAVAPCIRWCVLQTVQNSMRKTSLMMGHGKAVAAVATLVAAAAATCTIHENVDYAGNTIGKPTTTSSYGQVSGSPRK